jgi:hypothetical protein
MIALLLAGCAGGPHRGIQIGQTDTGVACPPSTSELPAWVDSLPLHRSGILLPADGSEGVAAEIAIDPEPPVGPDLTAQIAVTAPPLVDVQGEGSVIATSPDTAALSLDGPPAVRLSAEKGRWYGVLFDAVGGDLVGTMLLDQ